MLMMPGTLSQKSIVKSLDVAPIGVVVATLRQQGHPAHETEGFIEIAEHQLSADGLLMNGPVRQRRRQRLPLVR